MLTAYSGYWEQFMNELNLYWAPFRILNYSIRVIVQNSSVCVYSGVCSCVYLLLFSIRKSEFPCLYSSLVQSLLSVSIIVVDLLYYFLYEGSIISLYIYYASTFCRTIIHFPLTISFLVRVHLLSYSYCQLAKKSSIAFYLVHHLPIEVLSLFLMSHCSHLLI